MTQKTLDAKLARIHADPHGARDFILADAKDADMAMGLLATGSAWDGERDRPRSLAEYRELMREVARQELIDLVEALDSTAAITRFRSTSCCAGESVRMSTRRSSTRTRQRPRNHRVTCQ